MKTKIVMLSGGRDSSSMLVHLLELGKQVDYILFCDTGVEFPEMYDYIDKLDIWLQERYNKKITRLKPKKTMNDIFNHTITRGINKGKTKGLPFSKGMDSCTRDLKLNIAQNFALSVADREDIVFYIGYVFKEKHRVAKNPPFTEEYPLIEWQWNEEEVTNYLKEKKIYNHLYDHFFRTGCFCCAKQKKESWFLLYCHYPKLWEQSKMYELEAVNNNAVTTCFYKPKSAIGVPLAELEKEFKKRKKHLEVSPQIMFDWNDEDISCFC